MKLLQNELSLKYDYKKLNEHQSNIARTIYANTIPKFLKNIQPLYTTNGTLVCNNFDRIVIGDYGAFIEFSGEQANKEAFMIALGQEYRLEPKYNNAKYIWLTTKDNSRIKIYYQKHTVTYADYQPQKYYVSVYEVYPEAITQLWEKLKTT